MVAAAVVGSAVVGAGVGIYGANKAANAQEDASDAANETQRYIYDQTRSDNMPALKARDASLARLQMLLGIGGNTGAAGFGSLNKPFTGSNLEDDPGYQFRLQQGRDALEGSAAARGGLYSGATLKALTDYNQGSASNEFQNAWNRDQANDTNTVNRLLGVAGMGQTGFNPVNQAGMNYANQVGDNLIGAGNARGAASIATGNAIGGALNQGTAWWMRNQTPPAGADWSAYDTGGYGNPTDPYVARPPGYDYQGGDYSDVRLKTDIERIGTSPRGYPWYRWKWKHGGTGAGVIAQEVQAIDPSAVRADANGFLMVDYRRV